MPPASSRQRFTLGLGVVLTVVLCAWPPAAALAARQPAAPAADNSRLQQVQQQIESHQDLIESVQITALNLEQELNRIDSEIKKGQETLAALRENLHRQEGHIALKEGEIAILQTKKEAIAVHVKKRLAAFYQTGEVGVVNALFSMTNLGDLLNLQEYVQALFQYDQRILQGYRDQISLLAGAKDDLTRAKDQLQALIVQVQEGEAALVKSREERDRLLVQARAERELYRQALKELKVAAESLAKTIKQAQALEQKAIKKKISRQRAKNRPAASPTRGFASRQGDIPPPAPGRIIRGFGPYTDQFGNQLHADGIDLAVPAGTAVTAMHPGRVIFAERMAGYGNLLIIDHGDQYYTLVSGLASLAKQKDEEVKEGDALGTFERASDLPNPGLHVEIRQGTTPVDPLLWLDPSQLAYPEGPAVETQ